MTCFRRRKLAQQNLRTGKLLYIVRMKTTFIRNDIKAWNNKKKKKATLNRYAVRVLSLAWTEMSRRSCHEKCLSGCDSSRLSICVQ